MDSSVLNRILIWLLVILTSIFITAYGVESTNCSVERMFNQKNREEIKALKDSLATERETNQQWQERYDRLYEEYISLKNSTEVE